ncbi:uncharacterized protein LODBEIA_P23600 [Lodderomyces beijingensis]|uniref:Oxidation resistance protein 1 n=1 Tax=Lodderomyces beijingensis TaxID=1775926 RepID=A0ABP0ZLZ4_9ASCO
MSFLFRRSQESARPDENPQKPENPDEVQERQLDLDEKTMDPALEESVPELSDEKVSEAEKRPVKKRTSLLQNLMGNSSRNTSSSSLVSSVSTTSSPGSGLPPLPPLVLSGYKPNAKHKLLDQELASNVRNLLPPRLQLFDTWELIYSLSHHGMSLNTLFRNSKPEHQLLEARKLKKAEKGFGEAIVSKMMVAGAPKSSFTIEQKRPQGYVLIIKDEHLNKFGAYLNEYLRPVESKRYYGNGECFLWKVEKYDPSKLDHPQARDNKASAPVAAAAPADTRFKAFMYTGINDNIIYSNRDFIAIGSSKGNNGLYIDSSLSTGVSYPCDTFGNEVLNSRANENLKSGHFKIVGLELWRVGSLE